MHKPRHDDDASVCIRRVVAGGGYYYLLVPVRGWRIIRETCQRNCIALRSEIFHHVSFFPFCDDTHQAMLSVQHDNVYRTATVFANDENVDTNQYDFSDCSTVQASNRSGTIATTGVRRAEKLMRRAQFTVSQRYELGRMNEVQDLSF
jgi:hypothetical protein